MLSTCDTDGNTMIRPARPVSPGRIIQREMDARGLTVDDLAERMGVPVETVQALLLDGHITSEIAGRLATAFRTSARMWLNLEAMRYEGGE